MNGADGSPEPFEGDYNSIVQVICNTMASLFMLVSFLLSTYVLIVVVKNQDFDRRDKLVMINFCVALLSLLYIMIKAL
jgi:hypothetical protein